MSRVRYCQAKLSLGTDFERPTRAALIDAIAEHYADGYAGPDESSSPPEYAEVGTIDGDDDGIVSPVSPDELKKFNAAVAEAFEEAIEGWDGPSDYEEHNTHFGLR